MPLPPLMRAPWWHWPVYFTPAPVCVYSWVSGNYKIGRTATWVMMALALWFQILFVMHVRRFNRLAIRTGGRLCPTCGYSLTGHEGDGPCPECGIRVERESATQWWVASGNLPRWRA